VLPYVQRLGEIKGRQDDAAIREVTNHAEIHRSGPQRDSTLVITSQTVLMHDGFDAVCRQVAVDFASPDESQPLGGFRCVDDLRQ
jgi:hypothetical protein